MSPDRSAIPFPELAALADNLLEESEDDVERLAARIGSLDADVRNELVVSDLLNAWQVFYYYFRTMPDELVKERLELEPASSLAGGIRLEETDFLEMFFLVRDGKPLIAISDGEKVVASFFGSTAYENGVQFLGNPEYSE